MDVKKAIIPAAGLGTRFLPLSKVLPKELLPLVDVPLIDFVVQEAKNSEIDKIIFVLQESKKFILDYFKQNKKLENILEKDSRRREYLKIIKEKEKELENLSFSLIFQPFPKGDGDAVMRARNFIKKEGFAVMFPDDVFESKVPPLAQIKKIFQTSQKPVIGLKRIPKDKVSSYGIVSVEKIASNLFKIKGIKEKPNPDEAPSDLAIVGRYILTPEIFSYLKKTKENKKGEIVLAEALNLMIEDGKIIYGYEISGKWLECGRKIDWFKSNLYLLLNHPEYGPILKEFLKEIKK